MLLNEHAFLDGPYDNARRLVTSFHTSSDKSTHLDRNHLLNGILEGLSATTLLYSLSTQSYNASFLRRVRYLSAPTCSLSGCNVRSLTSCEPKTSTLLCVSVRVESSNSQVLNAFLLSHHSV